MTTAAAVGRRLRTPPLVASCIAGFAVGVNFTNVGAIAGQAADAYGVSLATIGLMTTALVGAHALLQVPGGRGTDRFGAWRVAITAAVLVTACNIGLLAAPDATLALTLRAVMGLGTAFAFVAQTDLIRSGNGTAFGQGMFGGIGYGATAVAVAVVPQMTGAFGWRAPYVLSIALGVCALVALATTARPPRRHLHPDRPARIGRSVFTDPGLYRLGALHGIGLSSLAAANWISTLFERAYGLSTGAAGLLGGLAIGTALVSRPLAGLVLHHRDDRVRLMLALSLVAGAAGVLVLALASSIVVGFLGAIVFGAAAGAFFAPSMHGAGRLRADAPATAVAYVNSLGNCVVIVATPLLGVAFEHSGNGRIGFALLAVVWALGLAVIPARSGFGPTAAPQISSTAASARSVAARKPSTSSSVTAVESRNAPNEKR